MCFYHKIPALLISRLTSPVCQAAGQPLGCALVLELLLQGTASDSSDESLEGGIGHARSVLLVRYFCLGHVWFDFGGNRGTASVSTCTWRVCVGVWKGTLPARPVCSV
jgi:hypothetical protein